MKKYIKDILQISFFSALFSLLLSIFPQITLEGALIFMGSLLMIASIFAATAYKSPDRRIFKFLTTGKNQKFFSDADQTRVNRKTSEAATKKMILSGVFLLALSYFAYFLHQ